MVLAGSRRIPRAPRYSGIPQSLQPFTYRAITLYGGLFQSLLLGLSFVLFDIEVRETLQPPAPYYVPKIIKQDKLQEFSYLTILRRKMVLGLGCSLFAHRYLGYHDCFLLLAVLRCFTSGAYLHLPYRFG